jgi:PTS system ascorbate-specific IIA component
VLKEWLTADHIQLCERVEDWRQAVTLSAQPLLQDGVITPNYLTAIFHQQEKLGPYFVLAPGIAMPHARPEEGASALGLSLLKIHQGVNFHSADNDPVQVVVMLSAPDGNSHIELISQLAELFSDNQAMEALFHAKDKRQIEDIIARY